MPGCASRGLAVDPGTLEPLAFGLAPGAAVGLGIIQDDRPGSPRDVKENGDPVEPP